MYRGGPCLGSNLGCQRASLLLWPQGQIPAALPGNKVMDGGEVEAQVQGMCNGQPRDAGVEFHNLLTKL
jgi:hypothetical protein